MTDSKPNKNSAISNHERCFMSNLRFMVFAILLGVPVFGLLPFLLNSPAHGAAESLFKLSDDERSWLNDNREKLTLYFNVEFPPIEFSSSTGKFIGMGADIIERVEDRLGVTFIKMPSTDWNKHLAALESGECAIAPTIVSTPERQRFALFTKPYATVPVVIIVNNTIRENLTFAALSGRTVAVVSGFATEAYVLEKAQGRFKVVPVNNVVDGLRQASFRQVDAFVENLAVAAYHIENEGIPNLRVAGNTDYVFSWSIGVSRKYPLLFSAIQKALSSVPGHDIEIIRKKWVALDTESLLDPETVQFLTWAGVFGLLLLLGFMAITVFLKGRLNEKVASLKASQLKFIEQAAVLRLATEVTQAGAWDYRTETRTTYLSGPWFVMLGYDQRDQEVSLADFKAFVHPDDQPAMTHTFQTYLAGGGQGSVEHEFRLKKADGCWCWVLSKGKTVEWDETGKPSRIIGLDVNIHTLKETQEKIHQSEARFRSLFMDSPIPLANVSFQGQILEVNAHLIRITGYSVTEVPDLNHWWPKAYPDPDYREQVRTTWERAFRQAVSDKTGIPPEEFRLTCKDGRVLTMIIGAKVIGDSVLISFFDITERREKEQALRENMELLRATFNATPDGILAVNKDLKIIQANEQFYKMWRIPKELHAIDDEPVLRSFVLDQLSDPEGFKTMTELLYNSRIQHMREIAFNDGRVFECYSAPMIMGELEIGRVWNFRDMTEREKLQNQLTQSKKLEAVGILAGGVAHDFNNILSVIMGYSEMTLGDMEENNPHRGNLERILDAARRSGNLTRQLLTFARKQTLEPAVFDVNESVESTLKMVRRIIGENIELAWRPMAGPCMVKMDPTQFDQILINLCVNARDAITDVGRIGIETGRIVCDPAYCATHPDFVPGPYVTLCVSDDGSGMDQETLNHIFEPFYTTKGVGKGTGMGLATVYGIVKQSDGVIHAYSEPGQGTTFRISIPESHLEGADETRKEQEFIPRSQGETLLVVEDDPSLLDLARKILEQLGYTVITAGTPREAIRIMEEAVIPIHLFITDVIMPEMNGKELADCLQTLRPDVPHIFMSGYTSNIITPKGVLDDGVNFIQKPFSLKDMAHKVRAVLDGQ